MQHRSEPRLLFGHRFRVACEILSWVGEFSDRRNVGRRDFQIREISLGTGEFWVIRSLVCSSVSSFTSGL
jgi:hypothetical protein